MLAQDAVVQVATVPAAQPTPGGPNALAIPGEMRIMLYGSGSPVQSAYRFPRDASSSLTISFPAPPAAVTALQTMTISRHVKSGGQATPQFILPIARIYDPATNKYTDISPKYTFDPAKSIVTAILTGNAAQLAAGSLVEFFLTKVAGSDPACGTQGYFSPGLRWYDSTAPANDRWKVGGPATVGTHALLVLHGIFSCVEGTFGSGYVERLRSDGAYDYVVGYDYDWMRNPADISTDIANAVNGLGLSKIDIVAHSYGTINAMATVSKLNGINVDNLVLLAGPLNGSYLNDQVVYQTFLAGFQGSLAIAATANITLSALQDATQIYRSDNLQLAQIRSDLMSSGRVARISKIAGTVEMPGPFGLTFGQLYTKVTGLPRIQNDGIVDTASAEYGPVAGVQPTATKGFADVVNSHTAYVEIAADHTHLFARSSNGTDQTQATEQFIASGLSFEFDNSNASGLYPDSGAAIVLKGIGSRAHFYPINAFSADTYAVSSFVGGSYISYSPTSVPVVGGTSDVPIEFDVIASPLSAVAFASGTAVPTSSALFAFSANGKSYATRTSDFFLLPDCVSCLLPSSRYRLPASFDKRHFAAVATSREAMSSRPKQ